MDAIRYRAPSQMTGERDMRKPKPPRARRHPMRRYEYRAAAPLPAPQQKLSEEQRTQVVQRLAGFHSLVAIIQWLREEYGLTISGKGVSHYDPTSYGEIGRA